MRCRILQLPLTLLLALSAAASAYAQSRPATTPTNNRNTTVLPVLNKGSGRVEAVLLLEPANEAGAGARWNFRNVSLDTAIGLSSGNSLGLLCNSTNGIGVSSLASNHCLLANIGNDPNTSRTQRVSATTAINLPGTTHLGVNAGASQGTLPAWLSPSTNSRQGGGRIEQNDLAIFGQKDIGQEGFVSIAGTFAKARLIPLSEAAPGIADRWESRSVSIGGGYGSFSANIVGRVIDVPGQPGKLEGVGLGLTWRTPWSGQLTVGAENITTRGKNPFAPSYGNSQDGTVPYIRYEQDL
jgi:hypothetical protein